MRQARACLPSTPTLSCFSSRGCPPAPRYLVHALGNELPLTVDAGEGAVSGHLLERVGNISRRRRAAVRRMGAWGVWWRRGRDFFSVWVKRMKRCEQAHCSPIKASMLFLSATLNPVLSSSSWDGNRSMLEEEFWRSRENISAGETGHDLSLSPVSLRTWERFWRTRRIFRLFMWTLRSSSSTALSRSSWVVKGITSCNKEKKQQLWVFYSLNTKTCEGLLRLLVLYLIVGVVKVHRLTKSHFRFCPQVVQLDRSRELQDPTEENRGQMSATGRHGWPGGWEPARGLTSSPLWTRISLSRRSGGKKATRNSAETKARPPTNISLSIAPGSWARRLWVCPGLTGTWQDGWSGAVRPSPAWSSSAPPAHLCEDVSSFQTLTIKKIKLWVWNIKYLLHLQRAKVLKWHEM